MAAKVNALENSISSMDDATLKDQTVKLKNLYSAGSTLEELLPEAYATVREAAKRSIGQRHYDVQIMGGIALHRGNIAEMKTGEGKTLVATLASYLNALSGKGVHVVTVNDYLAKRDSLWMGRIHEFLGLTVGVILSNMDPLERKKAYICDITYGTNNEFGFDYLRDNMVGNKEELTQRGHNFAVIDEVDSILIDEARTPLIISGPADKATEWYEKFAMIVKTLVRERDYEVDEKKKTVGILEPGIDRVEESLGIENLYENSNTHLITYLNSALKAKELFKKDVDYIIQSNELLIVDEHTGRVLSGRRYSEGLHQALEAKEKVTIQDENQTLATITLQNYFRLYGKLSGMTGTALTEASEFMQIYSLGVVQIPTNKPSLRVDYPDLVFLTHQAKLNAIIEDIITRHKLGQPILVGTVSVESSEEISHALKLKGIKHEVLNAKQHEREAHIVALAGQINSVTVATNMAGRGTDIILGGNPDYLATLNLPSNYTQLDEATQKKLHEKELLLQKDNLVEIAKEINTLGGLYILGTARHDSRRIDNQLRGRAGRQGDPGETRFYLSLEDDLMRRFNSGLMSKLLSAQSLDQAQAIESKMITRSIQSAQTQMESLNFEQRKDILKYDNVLSKQREVIYDSRRLLLEKSDVTKQIDQYIQESINKIVDNFFAKGYPEDWQFDKFIIALKEIYPTQITSIELRELINSNGKDLNEMIKDMLVKETIAVVESHKEKIGNELLQQVERQIMLNAIDTAWRSHLYEMDYLQEGIGLRAMAQRDPLVEYQNEGFHLFTSMLEQIKENVVHMFLNLNINIQEDIKAIESESEKLKKQVKNSFINSSNESKNPNLPSRNSLCSCGSGKKFKRCHGENKLK
jgi:preprotein translocase subunit SecA